MKQKDQLKSFKNLQFKIHFRNNFDDSEDSIKRRLAEWNEKTRPLARKLGPQITYIWAEKDEDDIFIELQKVMDAICKSPQGAKRTEIQTLVDYVNKFISKGYFLSMKFSVFFWTH